MRGALDVATVQVLTLYAFSSPSSLNNFDHQLCYNNFNFTLSLWERFWSFIIMYYVGWKYYESQSMKNFRNFFKYRVFFIFFLFFFVITWKILLTFRKSKNFCCCYRDPFFSAWNIHQQSAAYPFQTFFIILEKFNFVH